MDSGTCSQTLYDENVMLKHKISEYAEQINALILETHQLKEKLFGLNCVDDAVNDLPRKVARKDAASNVNSSRDMPVTNLSGSSVNDNNLRNGKKQRKKIIQAINTNVFDVKNHILKASCSNFSVQQASLDSPVRVTIMSENEISSVRNALKGANVSFHEFKWSDEKYKCFIIKGLVGISDNDLAEVKSELIEKGLPEDISLELYVTGYMRAHPNKMHNKPVKLVVPPNFDIAVLDSIKFINHLAVRFINFKSKSVIQCKNCQRFGHSAGGCQHQHRCVKCGQNHFRVDCPRTLNRHHKLKCCNCGGEHTANNLASCSYYQQNFGTQAVTSKLPKHLSDLNATKREFRQDKGTVNASFKRSGTSFADAARDAISSKNLNKSNNVKVSGLGAGDELHAKIEAIYQMVLNHETLLIKLMHND